MVFSFSLSSLRYLHLALLPLFYSLQPFSFRVFPFRSIPLFRYFAARRTSLYVKPAPTTSFPSTRKHDAWLEGYCPAMMLVFFYRGAAVRLAGGVFLFFSFPLFILSPPPNLLCLSSSPTHKGDRTLPTSSAPRSHPTSPRPPSNHLDAYSGAFSLSLCAGWSVGLGPIVR